ncbi:MAG: hypothetical protein ACTSVV_11180 [Promethearchaeota archaeon]
MEAPCKPPLWASTATFGKRTIKYIYLSSLDMASAYQRCPWPRTSGGVWSSWYH